MPVDLKLTVLDQSPFHPADVESRQTNAGKRSIELAQICDALGYTRYWVAEHHNSPHFAGPSPEILIASIASVTQNMRVGSGGVMLSHYSAFKVAEIFNMLNALFPERIDLGIGRAPGGDTRVSSALAWPDQPQPGNLYPTQAATLKALLNNNLPADHSWSGLHISPLTDTAPELWMLGSSGGSAELAGQLGMNLALARFITPDHCTPDIFDTYERAWQVSEHQDVPNKMLAIGSFCAETQIEAELLASTAVYRKMSAHLSEREILLSPEAVQDRRKRFSVSEEAQYVHTLKGYTVGTPDRCRTEIEDLSNEFGTEEIAIVTVTYDFSSRVESYRLLSSCC